jgi:uncharacterized membrane protein
MIETSMNSLYWVMAICSALMAGTYLTFSMVIMPSLKLLPGNDGARAMNAINRKILKTGFMPLFFVSTLLAALLVGMSLWQWQITGAWLGLLGGLIYFVGMFVVTAAGNVPLNNELDRAKSDEALLTQVWIKYLSGWTRWNTIRAIACTVTLITCIAAV